MSSLKTKLPASLPRGQSAAQRMSEARGPVLAGEPGEVGGSMGVFPFALEAGLPE